LARPQTGGIVNAVTLERLAREQLPSDLTLEVDPSARTPFAAYNVVGSFENAEVARKALQAAETAGADPGRLSLLLVGGRPVRAPEGGGAVGPDPEGVAGYTGRRIVPGAIIGGVLGAGGVAVAAGVVGSVGGGELAAAAIGGGVLFAAVGGMVGAFSGMEDSDAWRSTFTDLRHELALAAVHTDDAEAAEAARRRFTEVGARRTWLFDAQGRQVGGKGGLR